MPPFHFSGRGPPRGGPGHGLQAITALSEFETRRIWRIWLGRVEFSRLHLQRRTVLGYKTSPHQLFFELPRLQATLFSQSSKFAGTRAEPWSLLHHPRCLVRDGAGFQVDCLVERAKPPNEHSQFVQPLRAPLPSRAAASQLRTTRIPSPEVGHEQLQRGGVQCEMCLLCSFLQPVEVLAQERLESKTRGSL